MPNNDQLFPEGNYIGVILSQGFSRSPQKGTPEFFLRVRITHSVDYEGDMRQELPAPEQVTRIIHNYLSGGAVDITIQSLRAVGFSGDSFRQLDPHNDGYTNLTGSEVSLYCKWENFADKTYDKFSIRTQSSGDGNYESLDSKAIAELDALFGRKLKGQPAVYSAQKKEATVLDDQTREEEEEDDIPF